MSFAHALIDLAKPLISPFLRSTADGDSTTNSTNLAIKGIIAIKAMAQISAALHQDSDANHYAVGQTAFLNILHLIRHFTEPGHELHEDVEITRIAFFGAADPL